MKKYHLILLTALFLLGCSSGNVVLDNAQAEPVTFTFNGGESHELEAGGRTSISLESGKYDVKITMADSVLADTSFDLKNGGLVYAGGSRYVIWKQLYGVQTNRNSLLNERWVDLDSIRVFGDFTIYEPEWIFAEESWDYSLDDDFPESKTMYITEDFQIESKVFRSKDLIEYYKSLAASTPSK